MSSISKILIYDLKIEDDIQNIAEEEIGIYYALNSNKGSDSPPPTSKNNTSEIKISIEELNNNEDIEILIIDRLIKYSSTSTFETNSVITLGKKIL